MRTCIGCGLHDRQAEMLRLIYAPGDGLLVDSGRNSGGRGGYLHRSEDCWARFARRKGTVRSLKVSVDRSARTMLVDQLRLRRGQ
jgi:predicted RNA-binding protein YlxR (DUF448 family)